MGNLMEKGGNGGECLFIVAVQNGRQQGVQVASLGFRQSCKQRGGRQPFQKRRNRKRIEHKVAEPDIRRRKRLAVKAVKCVDPYFGANMPALKQDANRPGKLRQFRLLKGADDHRLTQVKRRGDPAEIHRAVIPMRQHALSNGEDACVFVGKLRLAEEFDRLQQIIDKPSSGLIRKGTVTVEQNKTASLFQTTLVKRAVILRLFAPQQGNKAHADMFWRPGENGDLIQSGARLMPVLIAPQNHKVVAVLLQVESAGTADVSVLVIKQHRRLGGEQAVEPPDRVMRFNHQMPGGVSGDGFDWAEKRRELRVLAGGEQAALNGAGIQLIAIGKAGGGFHPELPAGKVVVVGPVVGDIGDDPALNGVIARQPAQALAQEVAFGSPQGNERIKRIQIAVVGDAHPRFAAFILYPKAPQAQAIQQILVVADKPQHVAVILLLQQLIDVLAEQLFRRG